MALNPAFATPLQNFLAAAAAAGHQISIGSGYRSPERQAELWRQAVAKYGSEDRARKWVAPPGRSAHNQGFAADLSYPSDEARQWALANAGEHGLQFRMAHEPWHVEPAGYHPSQRSGDMYPQFPSDVAPQAPALASDPAQGFMPLANQQGAAQGFLHPAIQQIAAQASQPPAPDWTLRGLAMADLFRLPGNRTGALQAFTRQQAQKPDQMSQLEMLRASTELYELEEAARDRRYRRAQEQAQRVARQRIADELRAQGRESEALAVEHGMVTSTGMESVLGIGGARATYGTTPHYERDADGNVYVVRYASDGTKIRQPAEGTPFSVERSLPEFASRTEEAKSWGKMRPEVIQGAAEGLFNAQAQLERTSGLLADFESGKFDKNTGPLIGRIKQYYDPDVAVLRMQAINEAVANLQVANLSPVSEYELQLMQQMSANPYMTAEQNKAILRKLQEIQGRKVAALREALRRLRTETVEEYLLNPVELEMPERLTIDLPPPPPPPGFEIIED